MRNICRLSVLVLAPFFLAACNSGSSSSAAGGGGAGKSGFDQSKLETVIPEMIRLMEAKEYVTMMKTFTRPDDLKKMKSVEDEVKDMEPFFPMLLDSLKKAKDLTPTMEDNGNRAIYKIKETPEVKEKVTLEKVDGKWYMGK